MKFIRTNFKPTPNSEFTETWIKEDVDRVLGKLVKVDSFGVLRCIGFCSALDDFSEDYYYILYDGLDDVMVFRSAVEKAELLEEKVSKDEYIETLEKIKRESVDFNINDKLDRVKFRTNIMVKYIVSQTKFSLYNNKFFWELN
jgi:hypothetical protein